MIQVLNDLTDLRVNAGIIKCLIASSESYTTGRVVAIFIDLVDIFMTRPASCWQHKELSSHLFHNECANAGSHVFSHVKILVAYGFFV
jgi:hypothetical protein